MSLDLLVLGGLGSREAGLAAGLKELVDKFTAPSLSGMPAVPVATKQVDTPLVSVHRGSVGLATLEPIWMWI